MEIKIKIATSEIADLITTALEGGSNYWAQVVRKTQPTKMEYWTFTDGKDRKAKAEYLEEYVINDGGSLTIRDTESEDRAEYVLTFEKAQKGLELMAEKYPEHFADVYKGSTDGTTADVFLQLALIGDVIYG